MKILKKLISAVLASTMVVGMSIGAFASTNSTSYSQIKSLNDSISNTSVNFLQLSNTEAIYTYERNGNTYKNIDTIISPNEVNTEVYLLKDNFYTHVDTITSVIEGSRVNEKSTIHGESSYEFSLARSSRSRDWKFDHPNDGNTSIRNQSIIAIAMVLSDVIGYSVGGVGGVLIGGTMNAATYLFDKNLKTVYYHTDVYRDMNSSKYRPAFKSITWFYEDEDHEDPIDGNPIIKIIEP